MRQPIRKAREARRTSPARATRSRLLRGEAVLQRSHQMFSGRSSGHDHQTVAGVQRIPGAGELTHGPSEAPQAGCPHQAGRTGGNHFSRGGSANARRSS